MKIIIETSRLFLKEFDITDAGKLYDLNLDTDVIKYTGDVPFKTVDDAMIFISNYDEYVKHGFGRWSVILKSTHEFIGWCGLKVNEENLIDLGFRFFKKYWNKGYATESAKASLDYGFENLNIEIIIGRASKQNKASIRVLEKIGMYYWKDSICHGIDECVYYKIDNYSLKN